MSTPTVAPRRFPWQYYIYGPLANRNARKIHGNTSSLYAPFFWKCRILRSSLFKLGPLPSCLLTFSEDLLHIVLCKHGLQAGSHVGNLNMREAPQSEAFWHALIALQTLLNIPYGAVRRGSTREAASYTSCRHWRFSMRHRPKIHPNFIYSSYNPTYTSLHTYTLRLQLNKQAVLGSIYPRGT